MPPILSLNSFTCHIEILNRRKSYEEHTFFRITIPCHEAAGNIIADIATREKAPDSSQKVDKNIPDVLKDVGKDVGKDLGKDVGKGWY